MAMRRVYAVGVIAVAVVALVGVMVANIGYTRHVQERADQRWCDLLASLDVPEVPATTERGRAVQQQIHQLRVDLGCEGG